MAVNKYALARYILIDKLLHKYQYVKTSHITEFCKEKLKCDVTRRTIQMDIYAMQYDSFIAYYAPIEYSKKEKAYYYRDSEYRLIPFRFSEKEMELMQKLFISAKNYMQEDEYKLFINIINKIQKFYD